METKPYVLVLDDDADILKEIHAHLQEIYNVVGVQTLIEALDKLDTAGERKFSIAIVDMRLKEGTEAGLTFVEKLNEKEERPLVIILTAYPNLANANRCMQEGSFGYVEKGTESTFDLLEDTCSKAYAHWLQKQVPVIKKPGILVLDDDTDVLKEMNLHLNDKFNVKCVEFFDEAQRAISESQFSVLVTEMQLQEDDKAGLRLAQELSRRELRPEIIILTSFLSILNVSECMQVGVFGYVEKGKENSFDILENTCIKASEKWYRNQNRISPPLIEHHIALLCGDVSSQRYGILNEDEDKEILSIAKTLKMVASRETEKNKGYTTKWSGDSFVAAFSMAADAVNAALAIQRELESQMTVGVHPPVQFRASVHWGKVEQLSVQKREEVRGSTVLTGLQALAQVKPGKVVLTQQAWEELGDRGGFQVAPLPQDDYQPTSLGAPIPLAYVRQPLPLWIQVAFNAATEIEALSLDLPFDLAERHDAYARRTCRDETLIC